MAVGCAECRLLGCDGRYCSSEEVVELKGRVACEVSTADELVMTELIFSNTFQELTPEQAAALVSCFVWQEKTKEGPSRLREQLAAPLAQLRDVARRVAKVQLECKVRKKGLSPLWFVTSTTVSFRCYRMLCSTE